MKALNLYQIIKAYTPDVAEQNICGLQNCNKCDSMQRTMLIDFDAVKEKKYSGLRGQNFVTSADGVKNSFNNENVFYFIESKSIENVITNPRTGKLSDESTIDRQSEKFIDKIEKKLPDSMKICCELANEPALFSTELQPALVFVSDIDTKQEPLNSFFMNLKKLSEPEVYYETIKEKYGTKVYYEIIFNKKITTGLTKIKQNRKVNVYYTYCIKFDKELSSDFQNSLI